MLLPRPASRHFYICAEFLCLCSCNVSERYIRELHYWRRVVKVVPRYGVVLCATLMDHYVAPSEHVSFWLISPLLYVETCSGISRGLCLAGLSMPYASSMFVDGKGRGCLTRSPTVGVQVAWRRLKLSTFCKWRDPSDWQREGGTRMPRLTETRAGLEVFFRPFVPQFCHAVSPPATPPPLPPWTCRCFAALQMHPIKWAPATNFSPLFFSARVSHVSKGVDALFFKCCIDNIVLSLAACVACDCTAGVSDNQADFPSL